jgi:S-adenosylmethionine:tRNA ribosyltransferase-isomerase
MRKDEFSYSLPDELIAQYPSGERGADRLLCLDAAAGRVVDRQFAEFVEIMVERVLDEHRFMAQMRYSKTPRPGSRIVLDQDMSLEVRDRNGDMFTLEVTGGRTILSVLEELGHVPLPPYIKRDDTGVDRERYQTIYARRPGAVAAPTAGLHFTGAMLRDIADRGIRTGFLTLHVGAGTFQPVRTATIEEHRMHSELLYVSAALCAEVEAARKRGGRVIAIGTTSARGLETAGRSGGLRPYAGDTDIFIYPGFEFKIVDALLTNFHLPESTLLMLVCAFAGKDRVLRAYQHAIEQKYRFYSYGDAMFITSKVKSEK